MVDTGHDPSPVTTGFSVFVSNVGWAHCGARTDTVVMETFVVGKMLEDPRQLITHSPDAFWSLRSCESAGDAIVILVQH